MIPDRRQFRDSRRFTGALATEALAPALRAYARLRSSGPATQPSEWRRGLILGSGHIGDVLYRTCSLEQLSNGLPNCRWSYLTMPLAAEILLGNPALHEILPLCQRAAADSVSEAGMEDLRARNFDVALCTDNVRHHQPLRVALALGIPNRVAFVQKGLSGLATLGVRVARASWPAQIRQMVKQVTGAFDMSPLRPRIYLDDEDEKCADAAWRVLPFPDAPITIAAAITTRQAIGLFPVQLFAAVLRSVLEREPDARILLAGSRDDDVALRSLANELGSRASVHAGTLTLRTFAGLVSRCDAFLGSDSGPRHIANAAGIPVFFVRNMSVPEIEAGRYCNTETDLAPPGQYLSDAATERALARIDVEAATNSIVIAARQHASARNKKK